MASVTLRDLYAAELHDLMNAEKQLLAELPVMAGARRRRDCNTRSTSIMPKRKCTSSGVRLLIEQLNEPARATPSGAMAALIEDARRRLSDDGTG